MIVKDEEAGAAILDIDLTDEKSFLKISPVLRSHNHTSLEQVNMTLLLQLPTEKNDDMCSLFLRKTDNTFD